MIKKVKIIDFPKKWIPKEWRNSFDIGLLEVNKRCDVLAELSDLYHKDQKDFKSLLSTLKMQLDSDDLLKSENRLQKGDGQRAILEFKAPKGHSRLFGFIDESEGRIIICTNTYWKTSGKKKKQNAAFKKAATLRNTYLSNKKG